MDKKNRLTRWDEWEVGAFYEWSKGNHVERGHQCVEVNRTHKFVKLLLQGETQPRTVFGETWRNRFTKQGGVAATN